MEYVGSVVEQLRQDFAAMREQQRLPRTQFDLPVEFLPVVIGGFVLIGLLIYRKHKRRKS
jgi:ABC-type enterobactin transport system permease subunit